MTWAYLATAPDQLTAELWLAILADGGVHARIRPGDAVSFLGVSGMGCRIEVPEEALDEARALLLAADDRPEDR